jgi:hypothetical protein
VQIKEESLNNQRLFKIVTADVIVNSPTDVEKDKELGLIFSAKNCIILLKGVFVNMKISLCNGSLLESGTDKLFASSLEQLKMKRSFK